MLALMSTQLNKLITHLQITGYLL